MLRKPIFFTFIVVTDAHLSHFKQPSSFKVKYSCLFVVAAYTSKCTTFPLQQLLLIIILLSHALLRLPIFYLVATDAHLVHLKQPSSFTNLAFLLCCPNFQVHPSIKATVINHMHSYDCLFFI